MRHIQLSLADESKTQALGFALAKAIAPGLVIYLHGDLGAGKTALTRALLNGLGHTGRVKSPTYTLIEPYEINLNQKPVTVAHFDLYRMADPEEFLDAGFREYFNTSNICIVEWPEKGDMVLPPPDLHITLTVVDDGRNVELNSLSENGDICLDRLKCVL